jgi:hypothetical protein
MRDHGRLEGDDWPAPGESVGYFGADFEELHDRLEIRG